MSTSDHFWNALLGVHSAKRRHESPEWIILNHVKMLHSGRGYWISGLAW